MEGTFVDYIQEVQKGIFKIPHLMFIIEKKQLIPFYQFGLRNKYLTEDQVY